MSSPELSICECGHAYNGHQHPDMAADPERLPCHHRCKCEAFTASGVYYQLHEPGSGNPYYPNFYEIDNHFAPEAP